MILKKMWSKNIRKSVALISAAAMLLSSGCVIPSVNTNNSDKDDTANAQAVLSEIGTPDPVKPETDKENTTEPENTDNGKDTSFASADIETKTGGFIVTTPGSFADRVQGLYKVENAKEETYVEFYDLGDNIYGFYSGERVGMIELFSLDDEGFISKTEDSMEVQMATFVADQSYGYLSNGFPAKVEMTITDTGIEFSNYDTESGEMLFDDNAKLTKIEGEFGHLEGYTYADEEEKAKNVCAIYHIATEEAPEEIIGSWILLGDVAGALMIEFTEEGFVQVYLKNTNEPVILMRGTYVAGKKKINGGTNIYLSLHYPGDDRYMQYNFCYVPEDDSLSMRVGDQSFGMDFSWENALFIPYDLSAVPRQVHLIDNYYENGYFADLAGSYVSDDDHLILLTVDGFYYYYDSSNFEEAMLISDGTIEANPGGYILHESNYKDADEDIQFGFIAMMEPGVFDLTIYDTKETKEFNMLQYYR